MSHARNGNGHLDLALLTNGLRAEREQDVTIDVAHRYFATPRRRFISPTRRAPAVHARHGHRASTAEVAIVLVDARKGVIEQTRRHAAVAALLGVGHVVLAVNKMDLVDWSEEVFDRIVADFDCFAAQVGLGGCGAADERAPRRRRGRVLRAAGLVRGPPLLETSRRSSCRRRSGRAALPGPVGAARPRRRRRAYAGRVAGGELRAGAERRAAGGRARAVIAVETLDGALEAAADRPVRVAPSTASSTSGAGHARRRGVGAGALRELEADVSG